MQHDLKPAPQALQRETHEPEAFNPTANKAQSFPRQIFSGHMLKPSALKLHPPPHRKPQPTYATVLKTEVLLLKQLLVQRLSSHILSS